MVAIWHSWVCSSNCSAMQEHKEQYFKEYTYICLKRQIILYKHVAITFVE